MRRLLLVFVIGVLMLPEVSITGGSAEDILAPEFTGAFSDSGIDNDSDGYFEQLMVTGQIRTDSASQCGIWGVLRSSDGRVVSERPVFKYTAKGNRAELIRESDRVTFSIRFSGEDIRRSNTNGPFLADLMLRCGEFRVDARHETSAYPYTAFRETPAAILNLVTDRGVDTTGDGLFDYLQISVLIEVIKQGDYLVSASILDDSELTACFASKAVNLAPGIDTVTLQIDGYELRQTGLNGNYLARVECERSYGRIKVDTTFTLSSYQHTQFGQQ